MSDDVREIQASQGATRERIEKLRQQRHNTGKNDERTATETHGGFESGALSSGRKSRYHLIPFALFGPRLADRYGSGADRYGEGNWARGLADRAYVLDRANHTLEHLILAIDEIREGIRGEDDNLAAVIWGAIFLMGAQHHITTGDVPWMKIIQTDS